MVFTYGQGGSKSTWEYHYIGQLYARVGLACLAMDPLGEEERHPQGRMGTRAHDAAEAGERAEKAGRSIMGKLVWDAMRGVDLLSERSDVDPARIGVAGYSLGGAVASWMAALEPRLRLAIALEWIHRRLGTPGWSLEQLWALPRVNGGEWCDRHGYILEKLYGTPLHWRGAFLPDVGIRPVRRESMACLRPDELGRPEFTLDGWLTAAAPAGDRRR